MSSDAAGARPAGAVARPEQRGTGSRSTALAPKRRRAGRPSPPPAPRLPPAKATVRHGLKATEQAEGRADASRLRHPLRMSPGTAAHVDDQGRLPEVVNSWSVRSGQSGPGQFRVGGAGSTHRPATARLADFSAPPGPISGARTVGHRCPWRRSPPAAPIRPPAPRAAAGGAVRTRRTRRQQDRVSGRALSVATSWINTSIRLGDAS